MAAMAARTPNDRLAEWAALNRALEVMEWESMVRRHPEYSERQVFLAVMRARYGPKLAVEAWPDILTELP